MSNTLAKKTNRSPSGNLTLRRPKVASTEMSELWKETYVPLHNLRFEDPVHQSARSVSWADVRSRKQNKNVRYRWRGIFIGGTTHNEVSMWRRCVP